MDGIAREIISGFLRSEGQYDEAFKCLQERYIQIMKEADSIKDQATSLELQVLEKKGPQITPVDRKYRSGHRPVQSFTTNITSTYFHCIVCSNRGHPLYACDSSGAFLWMTKVYSETK